MKAAVTESRYTSVSREAERGIRYAMFAVFVVGVRQRNLGAVVNAVAAVAVSYLPGALERHYDVEFRPWQRVYTASALLTHTVGMLGPYEDTWWWDHLTHALSATLLGGLVHASARRRGRDPRPRVLAVVLALGLAWEVMEYLIHAVADRLGIEPILIPYGQRDTILDLVFDFVGAVLVLAFGDRLLENFDHRRGETVE